MDELLQGFSEPKVLSVSDLNSLIRLHIEGEFEDVTVEGEIGSFTRASSGHLYFTIKDEKSQVRCVMWRSRTNSLRFEPEAGMQVKVRGAVTVYEPRGEYQITVLMIEPGGQGALQLAFEKLKEKLAGEGLFDQDRKRPLPFLPRHVGIVTSTTGAAIRDILSVLERRHPNLRVTIRHSLVQGSGAAEMIASGIEMLNRLDSLDVLVVTRGGGSLEDLWPFNEEVVARAIAASRVPVVSAVGHEIDFTIADFTADLRAPTPSAAAELLVGREADLLHTLRTINKRMSNALTARTRQVRTRLEQATPARIASHLLRLLRTHLQTLDILHSRKGRAMDRLLAGKREAFASCAASLEALSPLKALARGFSIVTSGKHTPLTNAALLSKGDQIGIRFAHGRARAEILDTSKDEKND